MGYAIFFLMLYVWLGGRTKTVYVPKPPMIREDENTERIDEMVEGQADDERGCVYVEAYITGYYDALRDLHATIVKNGPVVK